MYQGVTTRPMPPVDWHPQDWILIVEALTYWDLDVDDDYIRHHRARELQLQVAVMHGFDDPTDFINQAENDEEALKRVLSAD
jgi:hypothetical protein